MKTKIFCLLIIVCSINLSAQDFTKHVNFERFDKYAQSLKEFGFVYLFAEQKGDLSKGTIKYSAMLANGKGSIDIQMLKIEEFERGPEKLADINTGIYTKYDHRLVFWSLTKAKQGFLYIELKPIQATLILGMQPENTQEILEQTMLKIKCLEFFKQ